MTGHRFWFWMQVTEEKHTSGKLEVDSSRLGVVGRSFYFSSHTKIYYRINTNYSIVHYMV